MIARVLVLVIAVAPPAAWADWRFGGNKSPGIGGVGLAVPSRPAYDGISNPANFAFTRKVFDFTWPHFGVRFEGISIPELRDHLSSVDSGGLKPDRLAKLARDLGDRPTEFGGTGGVALTFQGLQVSFEGQVLVNTLPNADLQDWVRNGGGDGSLLIDGDPRYNGASLNGYGIAFSSLNIAYGVPVRLKSNSRLAVGGRARIVRTYYSHQVIDAQRIATDAPGLLAPEMGGANVISRSGLGVDAGAIYTVGPERKLHYGASIENLIEPSVAFRGTSTDLVTPRTFDAFRRRTSVGAGYQVNERSLIGADWVDVANHTGAAELRMGAYFQVDPRFGVGAGFGTRSPFTIGVNVLGFNVAYSSRLPLRLESVFRL